MLLIYSKQDSNRLRYTLEIIFTRLSGIDYQITTQISDLQSHTNPVLVYDKNPVENYPWIWSSGFLFEETVRDIVPDVHKSGELPVLFKCPENGSLTGFDIFSAVFYMVSRYEEYLPAKRDHHGRFPATSSLAFNNGFLEKPVVSLWTLQLTGALKKLYADIKMNKPEFRFIPTIDVDIAYKYLGRGWARSLGGASRSLFQGDFRSIKERISVITGHTKDPFDTYEFINGIHKTYASESRYFFLLGNYGGHDKSIPASNGHFRGLIKSLSTEVKSGLHPSYASAGDENLLSGELKLFEEITGKKSTICRHHYLLLNLPETYRRLIKMGIMEDYTMGFADHPGFRAGIAVPYPFFDLINNAETELMIWPFAFMDGTFSDYLKLPPGESYKRACYLADIVRETGGTLITVFHNETISETGRFKGWSSLYKDFVRYASPFKE